MGELHTVVVAVHLFGRIRSIQKMASTMVKDYGRKRVAVKNVHIDVLAVGETLVDMISDEEQASLLDSRSFHMYPGGQATNVALNVSLLGGTAALVANVGDDAFGMFLRRRLQVAGVYTDYIQAIPRIPTTLVVVTRSSTQPDFIVYRGADAHMVPEKMPLSLLPHTSLVHISAFALSREPSCSTILQFMEQAHSIGCKVSFDPNYHPRLWELADKPLEIFARVCPHVYVTKPSLDDCIRLFGGEPTAEAYAQRFLDLGAKNVVLTMGRGGALLATTEGIFSYPARPVEVVDVTGAGDSFWSGMLLAILDGLTIADAVLVGQAIAAIKIQQIGPLTQKLDRRDLYKQFGIKQ